jgi:hypothetical protein
VLDGFPEDALLQADVSDIDAGQGIGGLLHQHLGEVAERVVIVLVEHLGPAQE